MKKKIPATLEEFIEGANHERVPRRARKTIKKNVLLYVVGRKSYRVARKIFMYVEKELEEEVEKYCSGNKTGIFNYLIKKALDDLKEKNEVIIIEEEDNRE